MKKCSLVTWLRNKEGPWKNYGNVLLPNKFSWSYASQCQW